MAKKCVICESGIEEEYGKLQGTIVKVKDENNQNNFIHVCSGCQKEEDWVEKARKNS